MIDEWEDFKKTVTPIDKRKVVLKSKVELYETIGSTKKISKKNFKFFDDQNDYSSNSFDLEKNLLKKIQKGKIKIDKSLDLHGLGLIESEEQVCEFIKECFEKQLRLVLIITGKGERLSVEKGWQGMGKLKKSLPDWLSKPYLAKLIVWFGSAPKHQGGSGATIIYLRKIKG